MKYIYKINDNNLLLIGKATHLHTDKGTGGRMTISWGIKEGGKEDYENILYLSNSDSVLITERLIGLVINESESCDNLEPPIYLSLIHI